MKHADFFGSLINFVIDAHNKVWVSDITYIQTEQGWGLFMYYHRSFF
jgi:transposase InsO family protein